MEGGCHLVILNRKIYGLRVQIDLTTMNIATVQIVVKIG